MKTTINSSVRFFTGDVSFRLATALIVLFYHGSASADSLSTLMCPATLEMPQGEAGESLIAQQNNEDSCSAWQASSSYPRIELQICQRPGGTSGYYRLRNNYTYAVRVRYSVSFHNGRDDNEGSTRLESGEVGGYISCFSCGSANGGASSWGVRSLFRAGEEGFW
jgi:hypothetical protein